MNKIVGLVLIITLALFIGSCKKEPPQTLSSQNKLTPGTSTGHPDALVGMAYCNNGDRFTWNGLCVLNNQWGASHATNSDHYQCIQSSNIEFDYKWAGSYSYVKGMPEVIAGWHYGNPGGWMTASGQHNLPSKISANLQHPFSFSESHYNNGTYTECMNCTLDAWLSNSSGGGNNGEIMVWGNYVNQSPIGSYQGSYNGYSVYKGSAGSWQCVTFRKTGGWSTSGNLRDFINYCTSKGWFSTSMYVTGIELGNEIMQGHGNFKVTGASVN